MREKWFIATCKLDESQKDLVKEPPLIMPNSPNLGN
jgi:hypothetical protein